MEDFKLKFIANFITDNRWKYFTNGLGTTYVVSFFAVILGVVIGVLIAVVRSSADKLDRPPLVVKILNVICKLYLTVIRGTPAMIQLLIMYYIVFGSVDISKRLRFRYTPRHLLLRSSVPVSCLWTRGSLKREEAWD